MKNETTERSAFFWSMTAFSCFAAAFVAGVVGSLLTTTWILNGQLHPWLRGLGLVLLVATMPILILGGHCLDLGEREDANRDSRHCRSGQDRKPLHAIALVGAIFSVYLFATPVSAQQISSAVPTGPPANVTATPASNPRKPMHSARW